MNPAQVTSTNLVAVSMDVDSGLLYGNGSKVPTFSASSQPANAYAELVVPLNGTNYVDNVLTLQNKSVSAGGAHGNAAIRIRDDDLGYERAAFGYGNVWADSTFGRTAYVEIGNIANAGDTRDTSFAVVNTHAVGAANFPNTQYKAMELRGDTGNFYLRDHLGATGLTWLESDHSLSVSGSANTVKMFGSAAAAPVGLIASGSDADIAMRFDGKGAGSVYLASRNLYSFEAKNPASAVNWLQGSGSATGQGVFLAAAGSDTDIDLRLLPKGAGNVVFGTYAASVLSVTGYITIKDSGGTTRRLLVG